MKCMVIGAGGYLGNVFVQRLLAEGNSVVGTVRSLEKASELRRQSIQPLVSSLEDPSSMIEMLDSVDIVVYAAYGYNSPDMAERELATGRSHLTALIERMFNSGKTFVLTSGTGVVPDSEKLIYDECTALPVTDSPVILARRNLEAEVRAASAHNVRSIVLRPPCVYGHGGSFIVPRFLLDHALSQRHSVYVQGTENNKRSAVHVDDLADLLVLAIQRAKAGSLFCTAAESGVTTKSIAEAISRCAGLEGKTKSVSLDEARNIFGHWGGWWSLNNQCSGEKARAELGWQPRRLSLLEDIERGSYAELARQKLALLKS